MIESEALLEISGLKVYFQTDDGLSRSVDDVGFEIRSGQTLGLVGESGCGKSVTALAILRLIASPPGRIEGGQIRFRGRDLLSLSGSEMRAVRGREIAMIFQEPMSSLNPVLTIGYQIMEAVRVHHPERSRVQARAMAIEALTRVGIPSPDLRVDEYPHQLSGGMKQRVMIAMALACNPSLLIADEPTTALDVTIQAQILDLLRGLKSEYKMSMLLITHDLGIVAENVDHVVVMYAGHVVESASVNRLFESPQHPYTIGLFRSLPRLDDPRRRLDAIPGMVPRPQDFPSGCRFRNRCDLAVAECETRPALEAVATGHLVACHRVERVLGSTDPS